MATLQLNESNPATTSGNPQPIAPNSGSGPPYFYSGYRVIAEAMRDAGYLDQQQDPSSDDLARYLPKLNEITNLYQARGMRLWLEEDMSFAPVAGYNCYQFGTYVTNTVAGTYFVMSKPLRFREGYWLDNYGNSRPLLPVLSRNEWDYLSNRTQTGPISQFFVDKQQNFTNVWLWLTPDTWSASNGQVHLVGQVQVNNLVSVTDSMNFPLEWFAALRWGLASEIDQGQPKEVQDKNEKKAQEYLALLDGWDTEDASITMQPDYRSQYMQNSFR